MFETLNATGFDAIDEASMEHLRAMDGHFFFSRARSFLSVDQSVVLFRDRLMEIDSEFMTSNGRDFLSLCLLMRSDRDDDWTRKGERTISVSVFETAFM